MVLEEAASDSDNAANSFSTDTHSPSDVDQYSTTSPSYVAISPGIYVDLDALPQRAMTIGQANQRPVARAIQDSCTMASRMLGRPVRQEEADALAYHFTHAIRIASFGPAVGLGFGLILAYRGRSTFRFPGWTPPPQQKGGWFDPQNFLGVVRGARAPRMWHVLRGHVYALGGLVLGQVAFGSYALTVGSARRMMDPRLRELAEEIRSRARAGQKIDMWPNLGESDTAPGAKEGETLDMARQRSRVQEGLRARRRRTVEKMEIEVDDTSPTGGSFGDEFLDMGSDGDSGAVRDSQRDPDSSSTALGPPQQPRSGPQTRDHTSPNRNAEPPPKQGGSAWERLRQQATSGAPSQAPQRAARTPASGGREVPSNADSFSFSSSEEDRQLARSEAQREFDARIEREREGKDFGDRGGPQRGWGS